MEDAELTQQIIGCAMKVHRVLGPGFLESVYEKALTHELTKLGLEVECQFELKVVYDGIVVGEFTPDMLVAGRVMLEIKGVQSLAPAHEVQLVNYLTAIGIEIGLLLNFGSPSLGIKRKYRTYRPRKQGDSRTGLQD